MTDALTSLPGALVTAGLKPAAKALPTAEAAASAPPPSHPPAPGPQRPTDRPSAAEQLPGSASLLVFRLLPLCHAGERRRVVLELERLIRRVHRQVPAEQLAVLLHQRESHQHGQHQLDPRRPATLPVSDPEDALRIRAGLRPLGWAISERWPSPHRQLPEPDQLKDFSFVQRYQPIAGRLRTALDARPARRN
ncbi:hypothetical protein ABZS86_21405 [Streptomyces sp. NPDC005355]|uniref:hypothetical protein n=1 Tax=Streptomyces sp. NPDC005355 TaxID=3157038 RepID=UPI0033A09087